MTAMLKEDVPMTMDWRGLAGELAATFAANAATHDAADMFVSENYKALKARGLFKALVPAELGGPGAGYREICDVVRLLAAGCGSTGLAFAMHTHIVAVSAWRWRHQNAPTDGLLKRIAAENLVLVSSGGSDWLKGAGVAEKVDGGFRINATKKFASGCLAGDVINTSAVYEDPEAGPTVLHFGAPLKAAGVSIYETWRTLGMRGTGSHDVVMKDVFIPDAAIAGRRPQGNWHPLFHAISMLAFPIIYAAYVGVAESARDRAVAIAKKREADEALMQLVGEMENALTSAQIALDDMIRIAETQQPGVETTAKAMARRTLVAQGAIACVERAMEVAGGASFYRDVGLERAFRDVQAARFHPLQEKPQLRYSGRIALGLDVDG